MLEPNALSEEDARDVAATSQFVFNQIMTQKLVHFLDIVGGEIDGIVLTGGCALVSDLLKVVDPVCRHQYQISGFPQEMSFILQIFFNPGSTDGSNYCYTTWSKAVPV